MIELKKYYKKVETMLPCNRLQKRKIMSGIISDINEYRFEHPNCSFKEIETYFGTPEDLALAYVSGMPTSVIKNKISENLFSKRCIMCLTIFLFLLGGMILMYLIICYGNAATYSITTLQ